MEHPLCKICNPPRRHSMREGHVFAGSKDPDAYPLAKVPVMVGVVGPHPEKTAAKIPREEPPVPPAHSEPGLVEEVARRASEDVAFVAEAAKRVLAKSEWDDCPHCAERRRKKAAAMKKWREKKNG